MPKIVVTGSGGFVGRSLIEMLRSAGHEAVPLDRTQATLGAQGLHAPQLESAMRDAHAVIHLAARAHVTRETLREPLLEFRSINRDGALAMAEMAARSGVTRFVFVSSIGVLGNASGSRMFSEADPPAPLEPYAISKWEAEQGLRALSANSRLEVVVARPPLVYGPHVKGNFLRLLRLVSSGLPLPFGAVDNRRSYVGLHNLCSFLTACAVHPSIGGRTFHVADGEDISTPALWARIAHAMGKTARLYRCPPTLLRAAASILGRSGELDRLTSNLRVDPALSHAILGWRPTVPLPLGIAEMVHWFLRESRA